MTRIISISLSLILCVKMVMAGEYGDAFLLASQSPQVQSLGYSSVATRVHSGHALNNPAGLANQHGNSQVGLIYQEFSGLSNILGVEVSHSLESPYVLGLTIVHSAVDGLYHRPNLSGLTPVDRRDSVLTLDQTHADIIDYREDGVFLSLAREFKFEMNLGWKFFKIPCRLPLAISGKYLDKVLVDNRGLGFGIDVGSQLFFDLSDMSALFVNTEFGVGLILSDILNTPVYWTTEHQDAIKRNLGRGFSVTQRFPGFESRITLSTSVHTRYPEVWQYGVEMSLKDLVQIRGGYDGYTASLGLGIALKKFIIDYSFSQHELSNLQKIGINYHL